MMKRFVLFIIFTIPLPTFAIEGAGQIWIPGIWVSIPVIQIPSSPNITVTNPMTQAYIDNQEQRAEDILSDPNSVVSPSEVLNIPLRISSFGMNGYNTYLGGCGHLTGPADGFPIITMEGNGDKMCWLGKPEYKEPQDVEDIWYLMPNGDIRVYPDVQAGVTPDFNFGSPANPEVALVCTANMQECYQVFQAASEAAGVAGACELQPSNDGISNAILHAAWAALSARNLKERLGYTPAGAVVKAREFLEAHEDKLGNSCDNPQPGSPTEMDCDNNELGLLIYLADPTASKLEILEILEIVYEDLQLPGAATVIDPGLCLGI